MPSCSKFPGASGEENLYLCLEMENYDRVFDGVVPDCGYSGRDCILDITEAGQGGVHLLQHTRSQTVSHLDYKGLLFSYSYC